MILLPQAQIFAIKHSDFLLKSRYIIDTLFKINLFVYYKVNNFGYRIQDFKSRRMNKKLLLKRKHILTIYEY